MLIIMFLDKKYIARLSFNKYDSYFNVYVCAINNPFIFIQNFI